MYTLLFGEQLETRTDDDGNEYQAYVIGGKEFLPNKVLKVGSQGAFDVILITTDKDIHTPLDVAIEGITKFLAAPGALKGHKAIRVQSPVQRGDAPEP